MERVMEYLYTGLAAILCIIWEVVLLALYLFILILFNCIRLFDFEE